MIALLAACSGSDHGAGNEVRPEGTYDEAGIYWVNYQVCYLAATGEVNDDTGTVVDPSTDPVGYAQEYAEGYKSGARQHVFEGCLDGLTGEQPEETARGSVSGAPVAL